MGWKDLQKLIAGQNQQQQFSSLEGLRNKPFWIWQKEDHNKEYVLTNGTCCFNHVLGLPKKHGIDKPLFDYQQLIYNLLEDHKHLWILKSTGLGITELFLRYMAWLCLRNNDYQHSQFVIVTGPNWDLSKKLISRMKRLFEPLDIFFDSKETLLTLNDVTIESFPSHHVDSFRSLDNPRFILLDECDFFPKGQREDVRAVSERYIAKSNPFIVMVSTPNIPGGLMQSIEEEPSDTCLYKRIKLDYRYGLDKIYSIDEIEKAKQSPSFDREYDLKYLGKIGNLYSQFSIDRAVSLGEQYDPDQYRLTSPKFMTVDTGFSTSKFAIMAGEWDQQKKQLRILESIELDRPLYEESIDRIFEVRKKIGNCLNIGVDSSNPELINSLKKKVGETHDHQYIQDKISYCKKNSLDLARYMIVVPISFNTESKTFMTSHSKRMLEDSQGLIAISPKFTNLITALRGAIFDDRGHLDKDSSVYDDTLDCFQMLTTFMKYKTADRDKKVNILSLD